MYVNSRGNRITPPKIEDLKGLWRRSLIVWPDGSRDETTQVRWLQGSRAYVDLRQPVLPSSLSKKRGLLDISIEDCAALARQEGFAGYFTYDGSHFEWARHIDFQSKPLYSDVGSLWWENNILIERGRDVDYIEHWHRDDPSVLVTIAAITMRQADSGTKASLLRVGGNFMFARDRSIIPPVDKTLSECVAEASSLKEAQALIDCEISFGTVSAAGFVITASSLPYRIGDCLDPRNSGDFLTTLDRSPTGAAMLCGWKIIECEGDPTAINVSSQPANEVP
jgi:hypothetical protein